MRKILCWTALALCATAACAYNAPKDTAGGLSLAILGFDEDTSTKELRVRQVPAGEPLPFTVELANAGEKDVSGRLRFWVNDDWKLDGAAEESVTVKAGAKLSFTRTARAKPSVLTGLYPLHAYFTAPGAELHPIAIFRADTGREPKRMDISALGDTPGWRRVHHDPAYWEALDAKSSALARKALTGGADPAGGVFILEDGASRYGAALVMGENGIFDASLAFSDGRTETCVRGFVCRIDYRDLGEGAKVTSRAGGGKVEYTHEMPGGFAFRVTARAEKGALRLAWDMPGVKRAANGSPRFTQIKVEANARPVKRLYAGFGNVIADPRKFYLQPNGFQLSTRHVGLDFADGLSLVEAVDVPPDGYESDAARNRGTIVAHNDAEFTFVPSARGAFDAAFRFANVSGYARSPAWARIAGATGLDNWPNLPERKASEVRRLAQYGLGGSVFVQHDWQRWGYDYRLPDIYPPSCGLEQMRALRAACREAKILFCPHDNYTDIYPDCTGFSYDLAVFDPDGRPQLAWYHDGRHAQSYRWASHAFAPFLERNADLMKKGFAPDGLFIDVFTAHPPYDYYERNGAYHPKAFTAQKWGEGFDRVRARWGAKDAPMVSEAGADNLVGHIDAAQSDHFAATVWMPREEFGDAERVPWHDTATHGKMILFAGGLGDRYSDRKKEHGYGSDDYLANTVIGGRNPLADGSFSRATVMTHWLLHDISKILAHAQFTSFEFGGDDIHRLHSRFSGNAEVYANRGETPWQVAGVTLPQYGFIATAGKYSAAVVERGGRRAAYARAPGKIFVDARPPENLSSPLGLPASTTATEMKPTDRPDVFTIETKWIVAQPIRDVHAFVHVVPGGGGEGPIVFQAGIDIPEGALERPGKFDAPIKVGLPHGLAAGKYDIRYGLFNGPRVRLAGVADMNTRICGGTIDVQKDGDRVTRVTWTPSEKRAEKTPPVDFGDVKTDGAFRMKYRPGEIAISPLPASYPFRAAIDLPRLGMKGARTAEVKCVDADPLSAPPKCRIVGTRLEFSADALARVYVITLR